MIKIDGGEFISDKEAEYRYGLSREWFKKQRSLKKQPKFIKIGGRVFYAVYELDRFFRDKIQKGLENL